MLTPIPQFRLEQVAHTLLEAGADVNKDGPQGYSYLMVACQSGHLEVGLHAVTQCQRFPESTLKPGHC